MNLFSWPGHELSKEFISELFRKGNEKIVNAGRLDEESYDADLRRIIADGKKFHLKGVVDCSKDVFVTEGGNQTSVQ